MSEHSIFFTFIASLSDLGVALIIIILMIVTFGSLALSVKILFVELMNDEKKRSFLAISILAIAGGTGIAVGGVGLSCIISVAEVLSMLS